MKKSQKVLAVLFSATLAAGALSGCEGGETTSSETAEPYEIQWFYVSDAPQKEAAKIEEAVNAIITPQINATLVLKCFDWGTYEQKVTAMISAGQPLDIVYTTSWLMNYSANATRGAFIDITDLLDEYAPDAKSALGDTFLRGAMVNGKLYGLPANKDKAHSQGFIYRKDLAEKYGFDMNAVKSFEDILPYCEVIKQNEPDITPLGFGSGRSPVEALPMEMISTAVGFFLDSDELVAQNIYDDERVIESVELAHEIYNKGYVRKDCNTAMNFTQLAKEGAFFAYLEPINPGKAELLSSTYGQELGSQIITPIMTSTSDATGSISAISVASKQPLTVLSFLNLLYKNSELLNTINFGIEGQNYTKTGDNTIKMIPNSGYDQSTIQWMYGNQFLNYLLPGELPDKYEQIIAYNNQAEPSPLLGFVFDIEPVRTEVSSCENVIKEFRLSLHLGAVSPSEILPKFQEKLKSAGIDNIVKEVQKQYDAWKR